jgi:hypothetical protein
MSMPSADRAILSTGRATAALARGLLNTALGLVMADALVLAFFRSYPNGIALCAAMLALAGLVYVMTELREQEPGSSRVELMATLGIFTLFLAFYSVTSSLEPSPYNAHVRQAVAFVHGHTYIEAPNFIEHAQVGVFSYQLHPPLPAILLIPAAAIWGMRVNQTAFSIFFGALDVALAWRLLRHFRLDLSARLWLTAFFGAGTIVWYETTIGSSWAVSMIVSLAFTIAALDELFGPARPLRLGIWAGLAALTRYDLAFDWPIYLVMEWRRRDWRALLLMIPGFVLAGIVYVTLNEIRYHSIFDRGVFIFAPAGTQLFGIKYFAGNLYTLLMMAPDLDETFPYIHPRFTGQSILLTSPAFILALRPSFRRAETALIGLAALIAVSPDLLYFTNGAAQFGPRHYLHAFPFLLVLMAMGMRQRADQLTKILLVGSVVFIAYGMWHIAMYGFG